MQLLVARERCRLISGCGGDSPVGGATQGFDEEEDCGDDGEAAAVAHGVSEEWGGSPHYLWLLE